ncbi:hypothetical protein B0H14DRAFT_2668030 [Mycena olivaceomarginata]|nr:hypothetical protein B0H14DRAFT_2668030 [Mycena olivaceomarginata]
MARLASLFTGLLAQAASSATASHPPPNAARLPTSWAKSSTRWGSGSSPRSTLASRWGNWDCAINLLRVLSSIRWSLISFPQNPLFFELTRLDRVSSTVGINGTVYAAFGHTFSHPGIVLPPLGTAHSGAVNDPGSDGVARYRWAGLLNWNSSTSMLDWGMAGRWALVSVLTPESLLLSRSGRSPLAGGKGRDTRADFGAASGGRAYLVRTRYRSRIRNLRFFGADGVAYQVQRELGLTSCGSGREGWCVVNFADGGGICGEVYCVSGS